MALGFVRLPEWVVSRANSLSESVSQVVTVRWGGSHCRLRTRHTTWNRGRAELRADGCLLLQLKEPEAKHLVTYSRKANRT